MLSHTLKQLHCKQSERASSLALKTANLGPGLRYIKDTLLNVSKLCLPSL